jgi:hypothetical protein
MLCATDAVKGSAMDLELLDDMIESFFCAPHLPATNHEEWLLRLNSILMHREASVIETVEASREQGNRQRRRRPP